MLPRLSFLKCVGKAVLKYAGNAVGFGVLGDVLVDLAEDVWSQWCRQSDEADRQAELEELAAAGDPQARAAAVAAEVAAGRPAEVRQAVEDYLRQVPALLRRSLRRPDDPSGRTVPPGRAPHRADDLVALLPARLPRFRPGDRPLPGTDWELVELLGVGGFGEVWKARNRHFAGLPPAALKFCLDPAAREHLLRHEAGLLERVMSQGVHPGIVRLVHTYLDAEPPCLQYEYVEGGDLAGLIRAWHAQGSPPPREVTRHLYRLADIVGFAHRLDSPVVHRDLKPANILVRRTSDAVELKVADFGIGGLAARAALGEQSRRAADAGLLVTAVRGSYTPLYASPQQVRGEPPDPRDDVHALGVIWYQMLTGDLASGAPAGLRWPQRLVGQGLSEPLARLLASCFEERAEDRPADAAVLAEALQPLLPGTSSPQRMAPLAPGPQRGRELHCLRGHAGPVHAVALAPDGRLALSGGEDGTARLWDVREGREVRRLAGHAGAVYAVALAPDGGRALTGGEDGTMRLWQVGTGRETACLHGHGAAVRGVAFSADGRRALSCGGRLDERGEGQGWLLLWDLENGKELHCFADQASPVLAVAFSADGRCALTGGWDHRLRLWGLDSGQMLKELPRHEGPVWSVAFAPDGRRAAAGSTDPFVHLWELAGGRELRRCEGHGDWVQGVAFSADGRYILSGSDDGTVRLWDTQTGEELCRCGELGAGVCAVALSADGRLAASAGKDQAVRLWELHCGN